MIDFYIKPTLLYPKNKTYISKIIPVLSYIFKPQHIPESTKYHWIVKDGSRFTVHSAEIMNTTSHLDGFEPSMFGGKPVHAKGDFKLLEQILGTSVEVEPLLIFGADHGKPATADLPAQDGGQAPNPGHATLTPHPHYQEYVLDRMATDFTLILATHFSLAEVAIIRNDPKALEKRFKGLSIGSSKTEYGFFMKGLKSAYERTYKHKSKQTYSGLRFADFGIKELVDYIHAHRNTGPLPISNEAYEKAFYDELPGLKKINSGYSKLPNPTNQNKLEIPNISDALKGMPDEYFKEVVKAMEHWHTQQAQMPHLDNGAILKPEAVIDPRHMKPKIVHEYGFRADSRSPLVIYGSGGFHANATRYHPDEEGMRKFGEKRAELLNGAASDYAGHKTPYFDAYLHQHNYDAISVFVSVSRSPQEAAKFIMNFGIGGGTGYLYLLRCVGAIDQEATFKRLQYPYEKEISVVGTLDWDDIIAARPIVNKKLLDYCYVNTKNPWAAKELDLQLEGIARLLEI